MSHEYSFPKEDMDRVAERLVPGFRRFAYRSVCGPPTLWGYHPHQVFWRILELLLLPTCPLLPTPEWDIQEVPPPPAPTGKKGGADGDPPRSLKYSC